MTFKTAAIAIALTIPCLAFAAGGDDAPPKPTETTGTCTNGKVWDAATASCVNPQNSRLSPETLMDAVREFAYAGQYLNAQSALRAMPDQMDDSVLTYWGFTSRMLGDRSAAMGYYIRALAHNPANVLARSYMGQALMIEGDLVGAYRQLSAIHAHGGAGSWAEASLRTAIETGTTYTY